MIQAVTPPLSGTAACAVKLPAFEGPLDLLLHLCRANEVDVTDIPIALISEQYVEYLNLMRLLDIDVAGEYLLMAATLAHIKSRMLLPRDPGDDEPDEGTDPRAELARRLAEYAVFQEAARELGDRPRLGRDVFEGRTDRGDRASGAAELEVGLFALVEAMQRVLASIEPERRHHEVNLESITLRERMLHVMDRLRGLEGAALGFEELLADGAPTRQRVVVTFLALLELARIQALHLFQNRSGEGAPEGPVWVRPAVAEQAPDGEEILRAAERAERELAERVSLDGGDGADGPNAGEES
ncbi:MAG: segregation/condensation protein A [Proteobacteria bacterium]|nr:segregation/condensation protein A [Pseudomonadota bacterium]